MQREIVVRFALNDADYLRQALCAAVRFRDLSPLRSAIWVMRETRRRGGWAPFTLGDFIVLWRRERALNTGRPGQPVRVARWRHR